MKKALFLFTILAFLTLKSRAQTVTDIDGNIYNTVAIGTQLWMKENLKVTHYNNGTPIPNVWDDNTWSNLTTGARAYYNYDSSIYEPVHGALYNWYAVPNLCPANWHVPTENDLIILIGYLGGTDSAGGKLKSVTGWNPPNAGATNSSGFMGKPGGDRYDSGPFNYIGFFGHWWASTPNGGNLRMAMLLSYDNAQAFKYYFNVHCGFLVRCVCDLTVNQNKYGMTDKIIQVFPNPADDRITIDCAEEKGSEVSVYNMLGDLLLQCKLNNHLNDIDISTLPAGMYVMKITGEDFTVLKKLIVE